MITTSTKVAWEGGACQVPMWMGGAPSGRCGEQSFGPQLPGAVLFNQRSMCEPPWCFGPCCPAHGGPRQGDPIVFKDGYTKEGRPMWCAVMPDFTNLQDSPAGFSGDPMQAIAKLHAAIATGAQP